MKLWSEVLGKRFCLILLMIATVGAAQLPGQATKPPESLSATEFSRLSREFSEEGGYFRSDNFTSNETSYLHIVAKLRQVGTTGGAYIGVGPEQNFTYIAKIRPRFVFLIDIRRQAIIQHLMYKAIFQLSATPAEFLSRLLSRPLPKDKGWTSKASVNDLLTYFGQAPVDEKAYNANLIEMRKMIHEDFQFPLSTEDQVSLEYIYKNFRSDGLEISYRTDASWGMAFPTLKEIVAETDLDGKQGNFLAHAEDYEYVRNLHRKNLIVPVVGDFAGKKALAAIGDYLKKNSLTVTAFYTSNVEQYLYGNGVFEDFAANVKKLPLHEKSLFIRSVAGRGPHPARLPGHRLVTLLQQMQVFVKDFDAGAYPTYRDLVMTHYISADKQ